MTIDIIESLKLMFTQIGQMLSNLFNSTLDVIGIGEVVREYPGLCMVFIGLGALLIIIEKSAPPKPLDPNAGIGLNTPKQDLSTETPPKS